MSKNKNTNLLASNTAAFHQQTDATQRCRSDEEGKRRRLAETCGGDGRLLGAVVEELLTRTLLQPLPTPCDHVLRYVWQMGSRLEGYMEKDRGGQAQREVAAWSWRAA